MKTAQHLRSLADRIEELEKDVAQKTAEVQHFRAMERKRRVSMSPGEIRRILQQINSQVDLLHEEGVTRDEYKRAVASGMPVHMKAIAEHLPR